MDWEMKARGLANDIAVQSAATLIAAAWLWFEVEGLGLLGVAVLTAWGLVGLAGARIKP